MKLLRIIALLLPFIITCACDDERDRELYFVGDSIIARWDVAEYFPAYYCHNDGLSGSGIEYIESLAGRYAGKDVVVMIGTNDTYLMDEESREEYASRYVRAVKSLAARRVFLYSVLPRDFKNDQPVINEYILRFNNAVERLLDGVTSIEYLNVYDKFMRDGRPNPQLYYDGLHLSPYGYEVLKTTLEDKL